MILTYVASAALVLLVSWAYTNYRDFQKNLAIAKTSGLPCIFKHPVHVFNPVWMVLSRPAMKWLRLLPTSWTYPTLDTIYLDWIWNAQYSVFKEFGDNILIVAPGGFAFWTADPDVINQITTRRMDFPKPTKIYQAANLFGPNVVSSEGKTWRTHRKVTGPPFNEKNNHLVWAETLHQVQNMVKSWVKDDSKSSKTMTNLADDTMRLSLHIISRLGFGRTLFWPGVEDEKIEAEQTRLGTDTARGSKPHQMTYTDALNTLLHNVLILLLLPSWLMSTCIIHRRWALLTACKASFPSI